MDLGSSYAMTEICAAYLYAQLLRADKIISSRYKIWNYYYNFFKDKKLKKKCLILEKKNYTYNAHIFYLILKKNRNILLKKLNKKIECLPHYVALHSSKAGKKYGKVYGQMTSTNYVSKNLIRLPLNSKVSMSKAKKICKEISKNL